MRTARPIRRAGVIALLALATALAAACAPTGVSADPAGTSGPSGEVGTLGTSTPTQPAPPPDYPDTAQAYATAVVEAWGDNDPEWLEALTSAGVYDGIVDLNASPNADWAFLRCDGAAGSSYCSFVNADDGDVLTLRITNQLLDQAHAATNVDLDKTVYPEDGVLYVKEFVKAWQFGNEVRMLLLSTPEVVDTVGAAPVSPTYPAPICCGGGLLQVQVKWSCKTGVFSVGTTLLGGPNAILLYEPPDLCLTQ